MSKPIAVIISDVHYNVNTMSLADAAMRQAITKANTLGIPLVVAGDLHDTKANLRGECVNTMIDTFQLCKILPYVLVGNHCKINEKSCEHSLNFLRPYANVVDHVRSEMNLNGIGMIPYQSSSEDMLKALERFSPGETLIIHQGVLGADMGHYVKDTSSLPKEVFADFRVISGHYHRRQDIKCGRPRKGAVGLFSYVGNPYTLNFGEADHPEKGFQILNDDGTLDFVPTNLRKHKVFDLQVSDMKCSLFLELSLGDLVWIKLHGTRGELSQISKKTVALWTGLTNFKLDLIPIDEPKLEQPSKLDNVELMDLVIDSTGESEEYRKELKGLWREVLEDT